MLSERCVVAQFGNAESGRAQGGGLHRTKLRYARRYSPISPLLSCCAGYICDWVLGPRLARRLSMLCPFLFLNFVHCRHCRPFGLFAQPTLFAAWSTQVASMRSAVCLGIQPLHAAVGVRLP